MHPDQRIAALAAEQHRVVERGQLLEFIGEDAIEYRLRVGRLHLQWPGVYSVASRELTRKGQWLAAVLHCGRTNCALSHLSAAALLGLLPDDWPPAEVSLLDRNGRKSKPGLGVHRPRTLGRDDVVHREGIPVTGHMRTLEDIRRRVPEWALLRAVEVVRKQGHLDLERAVRTPALRAIMALLDPTSRPTRSEAEAMFLLFCRDHGIPLPIRNREVAGYEADAIWPHDKVIVELDSREWHDSPGAFTKDRRRGIAHRKAGYEVIRVLVEQMLDEPGDVAAAISSARAARAART
jgi:very-short-patch-repair endonuclease